MGRERTKEQGTDSFSTLDDVSRLRWSPVVVHQDTNKTRTGKSPRETSILPACSMSSYSIEQLPIGNLPELTSLASKTACELG